MTIQKKPAWIRVALVALIVSLVGYLGFMVWASFWEAYPKLAPYYGAQEMTILTMVLLGICAPYMLFVICRNILKQEEGREEAKIISRSILGRAWQHLKSIIYALWIPFILVVDLVSAICLWGSRQ